MTAFDFLLFVGISAFFAVAVIIGFWLHNRFDFSENKNAIFCTAGIVFVVCVCFMCFSEIVEKKYETDVFESEPFLSELERWFDVGYDEGYEDGRREGYDDGYNDGYWNGYSDALG